MKDSVNCDILIDNKFIFRPFMIDIEYAWNIVKKVNRKWLILA